MSVEVRIDPDVIVQGASELASIRTGLPSGQLPGVSGLGDQMVRTTLEHLEEWWVTMNAGTADDVRALARTVETVTAAQVIRDHEAAVDLRTSGAPFASFRTE